ncbi:MAG: lipoyl(octanoyl) transferase LipB [Bacteroidales bacterium]|nr:lipoyl(octanoyl) transferase LipB [Bacteroidales bacterium]
MQKIIVSDLGLMAYETAWNYQEERLNEVIASKKELKSDSHSGYFFLVEHPHVFTLGNSGKSDNLLVNEDFLKSKGATFYKTNRGGDITYHGPGQIVGYPIINLEAFGLGVREYIFRLEEVIISVLKHYDIHATRLDGATGVWLDAESLSDSRKICAMGVRVSRSVTMHGFAFNVNTDLDFYQLINPCGFTDRGVTSLKKELGREIDMTEVKNLVIEKFAMTFGCEIIQLNAS